MAGFPSQFSPELWQQARDLVAQGMTMAEVSERTGITLGNIKMTAMRQSWYVPATALAKAKETLQTARTEVLPSVTTGVQIAESIAEIGQKGQISALRGMLPRFLKTFETDSELLSKPVEDWKTAGSMVNIFSKLAGLDKPIVGIQNNVWSGDFGSQTALPADETGQDGDDLEAETDDGP